MSIDPTDAQPLLRARLCQLYCENAKLDGAELERTALRGQSVQMRELLAYSASHGTRTFSELHAQIIEGTVSVYSLDLEALARLAQVTALQNVRPEDTAFAARALELSLDHLAPNSARRFGKLLAELYFEQRRLTELDNLFETHPSLARSHYSYLAVDAESPFVGDRLSRGEVTTWLKRFNRPFTRNNLRPVTLRDGVDVPFNRLTGHSAGSTPKQGPLVTVIMTSFKPQRNDVLQAAWSILDQDWTNLELLVVDDGSPAEYEPVLAELEELDERLKVIRMHVNRGTYAARNVAITRAHGEYITGQDADDWSHPQRIESQVNDLLDTPGSAGNQVYTITMTEDLVRTRRGVTPFIPAASTLMVRTSILRELGGFMPARKGSDNELRDRVSAYTNCPVHQIPEPLTCMRIRPDSLSHADFRPGWQHPARRAFWSSYKIWHSSSDRQELRNISEPTPIYVPPRLTRDPDDIMTLDVVYAADWYAQGETQVDALEEISHLLASGYRVGIMHLDNPATFSQYAGVYNRAIQEMISTGQITHVMADEHFYDVKLMLVRSPELLQFVPSGRVSFAVQKVAVVAAAPAWEMENFLVHYLPKDCSGNAEAFFGRRPVWIPQTAASRSLLTQEVPAAEVSGTDFVSPFDPSEWSVRRRPPRFARPVIGRWSGEAAPLWPRHRGEIPMIWPTDGRADVRLLGDTAALLRVLGDRYLPSEWTGFQHGEIDRRTFYRSIDFFVPYPQPGRRVYATRSVLEAMATGCVVVLPVQAQEIYGDAALYAEPESLWDTIVEYFRSSEAYLRQSERAKEFAASHRSGGYREVIERLIAANRGTWEEELTQ